jgi:predicted transcriptional regulator
MRNWPYRSPIGRETMRTVFALLTMGRPKSTTELATLLGRERNALERAMRALRAGLPPYAPVYTKRWERNGTGYSRVYALGHHADASKSEALIAERIARRDKQRRVSIKGTFTLEKRILTELHEHGPLSRHELAERLYRCVDHVSPALRRLQAGIIPLAPVRIEHYERPESRAGGPYVKFWEVGSALDAPLKLRSKVQIGRDYRARNKERLQAFRDVKRTIERAKERGAFFQLVTE